MNMVRRRSRWFERTLIAVGVWLLAWVWIESLEAEAFRRRLEASAPVAVTASDRPLAALGASSDDSRFPVSRVSHVVAEGDSDAVLRRRDWASLRYADAVGAGQQRAGRSSGWRVPPAQGRPRRRRAPARSRVPDDFEYRGHGDDDRPANGHMGAGTIGSENADADHVLSVHVCWPGAVSVCGARSIEECSHALPVDPQHGALGGRRTRASRGIPLNRVLRVPCFRVRWIVVVRWRLSLRRGKAEPLTRQLRHVQR